MAQNKRIKHYEVSNNKNLHNAKKAQRDEFYTRLTDIEKELVNYNNHFENAVVYCNCDDARESNFYKFFSLNFEILKLKKLICTAYKPNGKGVALIYEGDKNGNRQVDDEEIQVTELKGNGDFRSDECVEFLKEADIVVTNPPFSLFREYVKQLMDYDKKFIIIGNNNAITYKEIFPYIKNNQLWLGVSANKAMEFTLPNEYEKWDRIENGVKIGKVPAISWFTNLAHNKRNQPAVVLTKKYSPEYYPKFDNYDAIEVSKVVDIPIDYEGVMGVPITFLAKYNPSQFEIVDAREVALYDKQKNKKTALIKDADGAINGKPTYARILIKRKYQQSRNAAKRGERSPSDITIPARPITP